MFDDLSVPSAFSVHSSYDSHHHHGPATVPNAAVKEGSIFGGMKSAVFGKPAGETGGAQAEKSSGGLMGSLKSSADADQAARDAGPMCFPSSASVWVKDLKAPCKMENLTLGDYVLTSTGFSEVVGFLHREFREASFLQIVTSSGSLILSADHIVFVEELGVRTNLPSSCLRRGIHKLLKLGADGDFSSVSIDAIEEVRIKGFFAPLTTSGDIIVDGFLCSCYATPNHWGLRSTHHISDLIMTPFKTADKADQTTEGIPAYAERLMSLADAVLATN